MKKQIEETELSGEELSFMQVLRMFNINMHKNDARLVYNLALAIKEKGADLDLRTIYKIYLNKEEQNKQEQMVKVTATKVKTCKKCGNEFEPKSNRQVYCSEKCGMKPKPSKWKNSGITEEQKNKSQSKPFSEYRN